MNTKYLFYQNIYSIILPIHYMLILMLITIMLNKNLKILQSPCDRDNVRFIYGGGGGGIQPNLKEKCKINEKHIWV
jgi:hypothetical protein